MRIKINGNNKCITLFSQLNVGIFIKLKEQVKQIIKYN